MMRTATLLLCYHYKQQADLSLRGQYEKLRSKTENLTRILSSSRASTNVKRYAMAMCGYSALTYPAKCAPPLGTARK
jgi:hypothetical protein